MRQMWWPFLQASTQKIGLMSFIAYDIIFLVVFTLLVVLFLYTHRHNLKREGLLYLYRTKVGLRVIEWTSRKYASILKPMQYLIIASGYALMAAMLWFLASFSYNYIRSPFLAEQLRVPVLTPLIPYIDKLFTVDFLPPFYFTYWIIIIAIIAVPHEFAHGIFARLNKIRIHSTGFGFLGPFLAYEDSPSRRANLRGAITHINGKEINSYDILRSTIQDYRVGDNITITTTNGKLSREFNITLAEKEGRAFLGVGIIPNEPSGIR